MKKLLLLVVLASLTSINAQQTPVFSEYYYNPFLINPAYAGYNSKEFSLTHNSGLNAIEGAPVTSTATFISDIENSALGYGLSVINDKIGVTRNTCFSGAISYQIQLDNQSKIPYWKNYDKNYMSFGISAGLQLYNDQLLNLGITNDPNFNKNINLTIPTIGAGIMYNRKHFFLGVSSPNLVGTALTSENVIDIEPVYMVYSGFRFVTDYSENFMIKPSVLFKSQNGAPSQIDFNVSCTYKKTIELGMGYRTSTAINAFIGFYIDEAFRIIYSYNHLTENTVIGSTHGFGLSYKFI